MSIDNCVSFVNDMVKKAQKNDKQETDNDYDYDDTPTTVKQVEKWAAKRWEDKVRKLYYTQERAGATLDLPAATRYFKGWVNQKNGDVKPSPICMYYSNKFENVYNFYKYV